MTLIEGIGDEVTILVTIIVAVTTVVAAWFSTSVHEQQSYWQEGIAGSVVDPDPLLQESSLSADGEETPESEPIVDDVPSTDGEETGDSLHAVSGATAKPQLTGDPSIESLGAHGGLSEGEEGVQATETVEENSKTKRNSASHSSSFEFIDPACESAESKDGSGPCTPQNPDLTGTSDVASRNDGTVDENVQGKAPEDGQDQRVEQCVRRRCGPSAGETFSEAAARTADNTTSLEGTSKSDHATSSGTTESVFRADDGTTTSGQAHQQTRDQTASGVIAIKLRFLDETERIAWTNESETLGNFRRETFSAEIQSGRAVRFISSGQLLTDDSRTLASYGISSNHVIHCQISSTAAAPSGEGQGAHIRHGSSGGGSSDPGDGDFDLGRYMVPLFACILAFVWYLRFEYRYMFNATSTLSLTAVTAVFILALLAVWRS